MKSILYCALLCLICLPAMAQEAFYLVGPDGKKAGPFNFKEGEAIRFGTKTYRIRLKKQAREPVARKLRSIRIPEIQFRETDIRDVLEFLRAASEDADPEGAGVNIILLQGAVKRPAEGAVVKASSYPKLTMSLKDVSVGDALNLIKASTGYSIAIQNDAVVITPKSK